MEFEGRSKISLNLNLAPLIDVVLLLLIFFMLTSSYIVAEAIDLELPKSDTARPVDEADIVVTLHDDGSVLVSGQPVSRDALKAHLESVITNPEQQTITLKTASEESVQDMIDLMDLIRSAGARKVLIATQGPKVPGEE